MKFLTVIFILFNTWLCNYYQFFQRRVAQKARLLVQGGPLVHKYIMHSTIQNKIMNKHYTIANKQTQYNDNKQRTITNKQKNTIIDYLITNKKVLKFIFKSLCS